MICDFIVKFVYKYSLVIYSKISRYEIPVLSRTRPLTFSRKAILQWMKDGKTSMMDQEAEGGFEEVRGARIEGL
jgi:hypothetical protein